MSAVPATTMPQGPTPEGVSALGHKLHRELTGKPVSRPDPIVPQADRDLVARANKRFEALTKLSDHLVDGLRIEDALELACRATGTAASTVRRWADEYREDGIVSLLEKKR